MYYEHQTISRPRAGIARTGRREDRWYYHAEEKIGGIIIPDTAKEKPLHGTIKAVGQGTKDETMILKEGDEVLYGKYSGTELEFEGEKYLMMRQSDVLAVIEK